MRLAKITIAIVTLLILTGFTVLAIDSGAKTKDLKFNVQKLQSTEAKLKDVNVEVEQLKTQTSKEKEHKEELQKQLDQKEKERIELEAKLQAKAEQKEKLRIASENAARTLTLTKSVSAAPAYSGGGNKEAWMAAAGIPQSDWPYVDSIVRRESGWNPCAYNPGQSNCNANPTSACGLAQSLPCGKQAKYGHWTDPVANLKWQYEYVTAKYGGYQEAFAFWNANHWY